MVTTTTGLATSFITFTRTSNATVTDSNGFIKWAGHNLLTNSESFDASAWSKTGVTVTANSTAAPNSTTTADRANATATGDVYQSIALTAGVKYKLAIWAKSFGGTNQTFRLFADNNMLSSDFTATSSWQLFEFEFTAATGGASRACGVTNGVSNAAYDVLLWGAHLYRSDLGGMVLNPARGDAYYPTTPRNLLGFTEDWSNAAWTKTRVRAFGSGSVSNAAIAPNGLQTADLIVEDTTASNTHFVSQTTSLLAASPHVYSVYAKAAGRSWIAVLIDNLAVWFNLSSGTKGTEESGVTGSITPIGDGWYRCTVFRTIASAGANNCRVYLAIADNSVTYTGDGVSGIYLWGAQLSDSASLDAYSPVYDAAVTSAAYYAPRLDYDANGSALGLLVEEQRTNLLTYSAQFDDAAWTKVSSDAATKTTSPDGTASANLIYPTSSTTFVGVRQIIASGAFTSGVYTISVYAKAAGKNVLGIIDFAGGTGVAAYFTLTGSGTATNGLAGYTQTITPLGNGWYRCTMTSTSSWSNTNNLYTWIVVCDAVGSGAVTASGTNGIEMYGAQTELGSFATSYIPTGASTATRTADVASVSTQAFPYSATEGTLVGEVRGLLSNTITQVPLVSFGDANNRIELRAVGDPFTYNRAVVVNSGSTVVDINATGLPASASATRKVGFAFKLNDFATTGTGGTVGTTSSGTIPSVSVMNIGTAPYSASLKTNGWIARITYIPRRLSNSELQARTA